MTPTAKPAKSGHDKRERALLGIDRDSSLW